jgi:hypothetical protein
VDGGGVGSNRGFVGPGAGGFPGRGGAAAAARAGQVVRERDQSWNHAVEAGSRAEVLGGQLAEATERPVEVSARARTLAETLAMRAQARCSRRPLRWRSFRLYCHLRPGQIPPKVEMTPRVLLLPLPMSEPAGTVCVCFLWLLRPKHLIVVL